MQSLVSSLFVASCILLAPCWPQVPAPVVPAHPAAPTPTPPATSGAPATPAAAVTAPPAEAQDPAKPEGEASADAKKPNRRGIAISDPLVHTHCMRCHAIDDKQQMTRISYVRKSPEGWSETLKRMGRLHGLQLSPQDAKQLVRTLSNSNGLARSEAERGLYESERRVHWSEESQDQDFRRACAECHPLGRVLLQQRDDEEWQLLRATHVAMFPLARGQMGGGPPEDESRRFGGGNFGGGGGGGNAGAANAGAGARGGRGGRGGEAAPGGNTPPPAPTQSVGDRVLQKLAKDQPLFSPAWESWSKNRREVPLAGTWTVSGHETGRGDLFGTASLKRVDADEYEITWNLRATDGSTIARTGKGLLYAGYSWRGRSQEGGDSKAAAWREVLLLDDAWQTLRGRLFTGNYDELGVDVTLVRDLGRPRVLAVDGAAIAVPSTGHRLTVQGEAFPANVAATDFFVGEGLSITGVERRSDRELVLVVDASVGTELGVRTVAFGSDPGSAQVTLYDTVDYIRVRPLQGLARVGGAKHPNQLERYEAYAVHRGKDEKPYTDDDVDLFQVRPKWSLAEFKVRENDDDLQFVGSIDPVTGVFTPAVDGPNPARKWQANNIGDVFVMAEIELEVVVRPEPKKVDPAKDDKVKDDKPPVGDGAEKATEAKPATPPPVAKPAETAPIVRAKKTFLARSHLLVSVPIYMRWARLDWEDR